MKKYVCAQFMLELIIEENCEPDYVLRDQRGTLCARGDFEEIKLFLNDSYNQFLKQKAQASAENN